MSQDLNRISPADFVVRMQPGRKLHDFQLFLLEMLNRRVEQGMRHTLWQQPRRGKAYYERSMYQFIGPLGSYQRRMWFEYQKSPARYRKLNSKLIRYQLRARTGR